MSFIELPPPPEVTGIQRGAGETRLRFEDVAEDGRLRLEGVWPAIGPILWGKMEVANALLRLGARGVRAVLTYVALEGGEEPVSVRAPCSQEVRWSLGRNVDEQGNTSRILFDTWLSSTAPRGAPRNPGLDPVSDERVLVARAYGQHVFTRPAASAGAHRVTEIADPLLDGLAPEPSELRDFRRLLALPSGARALEERPRPDPSPTVFGLCHTDGNQHVNFLSYPRLAEEAALRRFAELGIDPRRLARRAEVSYRRPCFAGDVVDLFLQTFERDGEVGVVAAFVPRAGQQPSTPTSLEAIERPACVTRIGFR